VRARLQRLADWLARPAGRRLVLRALLLVPGIGFFLWIRRPGDFAGYLLVGDLVLEGRHIYLDAPSHINTWPPFFSLLCVPLALLAAPTPYLARGLWIVLNAGLVVVILGLLARLVHGQRLQLRAEGPGLSPADPALLVPLLLSGRYVLGNFEHLQINVVLFALALGGLALQARGRALAGGGLLGLAAAIKVMPIAFVAYLAYRRRWRAAGAAALATAACSLSPILVFGWGRFWAYVAVWRDQVAAGWGAGRMNQSVLAMWDRWLGHRLWPLTAGGVDALPESGAPATLVAVGLTLVLVGAAAAWAFRGHPSPDGWPALAEWSAVFVAASIFGPVSWKSYLVVFLLPNALLFAAWRSSHLAPGVRRGAAGVLGAAFVLGGLTAPGLVSRPLAERLEMSSVVTLAALVLLGGVLWFRRQLPLAAPGGILAGPGRHRGA
jgi:alpha-1,2-mannosyltransferase